jgi:hypothetical protein
VLMLKGIEKAKSAKTTKAAQRNIQATVIARRPLARSSSKLGISTVVVAWPVAINMLL